MKNEKRVVGGISVTRFERKKRIKKIILMLGIIICGIVFFFNGNNVNASDNNGMSLYID